MRLFILGEIDEDLASVRIGNLLREIDEKLMRAAFEIHGDVQRVDIARLVLHFDLQQFLLRKNLFDDFPAERQPRRFPLQPVVFLEKRSEETRLNSSHVKISYAVFCLKKKKKK